MAGGKYYVIREHWSFHPLLRKQSSKDKTQFFSAATREILIEIFWHGSLWFDNEVFSLWATCDWLIYFRFRVDRVATSDQSLNAESWRNSGGGTSFLKAANKHIFQHWKIQNHKSKWYVLPQGCTLHTFQPWNITISKSDIKIF